MVSCWVGLRLGVGGTGKAIKSSVYNVPGNERCLVRKRRPAVKQGQRKRCRETICSSNEGRPPEEGLASSLQFQSSRPADARLPSWSGDYSVGDMLGSKYEVQGIIGRGSNGVTYKAKGPDGVLVAVKALSLRSMRDWKQLDLFQREARTLECLQHPAIPQYVDFFEEDTERDRGFFLVQELAEGKSLAQMVRDGGRANEAETRQIAIQLLQVLEYLASLSPPVTHRDVKPENIVLEGGRWGGRLYLVDFGGVQAAASASSSALGSTVVGTYGYMAPEQFRGAAQPATDLYGAGGTLLYLLTGKVPSEFPQERLRIDFGQQLQVAPDLRAVLEGLLEPLVEERMSAAAALQILRGEAPVRGAPGLMRQPAGARSRVQMAGSTLEVEIPRAPVLSGDNAATAGFAVVWNGTIAAWTFSALAAGSVVGAAFSIPFWLAGYQVAKEALGGALSGERIEIGKNKWRLTRGKGEPTEGRVDDLRGAQVVVTSYMNGVPRTEIQLLEGFRRHVFGAGLSRDEQLWLADCMNSHLQQITGRAPELPPSIGPPTETEINFQSESVYYPIEVTSGRWPTMGNPAMDPTTTYIGDEGFGGARGFDAGMTSGGTSGSQGGDMHGYDQQDWSGSDFGDFGGGDGGGDGGGGD